MYVNYREWIDKETSLASEFDKPIIGTKPRGSQRTPQIITELARIVVGWNTYSITDAIRNFAI